MLDKYNPNYATPKPFSNLKHDIYDNYANRHSTLESGSKGIRNTYDEFEKTLKSPSGAEKYDTSYEMNKLTPGKHLSKDLYYDNLEPISINDLKPPPIIKSESVDLRDY